MLTIPKINNSEEDARQLEEQIDGLRKLMLEAEQLRKRQYAVSICAVLLMLIILTIGIFNLAAFFKYYPKRLLMQEVLQRSREIFANPYMKNSSGELNRKIVPLYWKALRQALIHEMPLIKQEIRRELRSNKAYVNGELKQRVYSQLYLQISSEIQAFLERSAIKPDAAQQRKLKEFNAEIASLLTARIFIALEPSVDAQNVFMEELQAMRRSAEYRKLED